MTPKLSGMLLAIVVAVCAKLLVALVAGSYPFVGQVLSPTIVAIVLGVFIHNSVGISVRFTDGLQFAAKYVLMAAIVLLGATLDFHSISKLLLDKPGIIALIILNICLSFGIAYSVGRWIKIDFPLRIFIGGGCSICGGTAISALGPIIRAKESSIAFGISIVFFLDMITIVAYPLLGRFLHMGPEAFGILAGTAINDTSSVLAAGDIYSRMINNDLAYETASIVKLTRTSFLIVVAAILSIATVLRQCNSDGLENSSSDAGGSGFMQMMIATFPWFILCFIVMSVLNTFGFFHNGWLDGLAGLFHYEAKGTAAAIVMLSKDLSKFLIIVALAGVGLNCNLKVLLAPGLRPILLGAVTALVVFASSLTAVGLWLNL